METQDIIELDYFRAVASVFVTLVLDGVFVDTELPDELSAWGKDEDYRFLLRILQHNIRFEHPHPQGSGITPEECYAREKIVQSAFADKKALVSCLNSSSDLLKDLLNAGNMESHCVFEQQKYRMNFISKMGELINRIKPYCTNSDAPRHALAELAKIDKKYRCNEMND